MIPPTAGLHAPSPSADLLQQHCQTFIDAVMQIENTVDFYAALASLHNSCQKDTWSVIAVNSLHEAFKKYSQDEEFGLPFNLFQNIIKDPQDPGTAKGIFNAFVTRSLPNRRQQLQTTASQYYSLLESEALQKKQEQRERRLAEIAVELPNVQKAIAKLKKETDTLQEQAQAKKAALVALLERELKSTPGADTPLSEMPAILSSLTTGNTYAMAMIHMNQENDRKREEIETLFKKEKALEKENAELQEEKSATHQKISPTSSIDRKIIYKLSLIYTCIVAQKEAISSQFEDAEKFNNAFQQFLTKP